MSHCREQKIPVSKALPSYLKRNLAIYKRTRFFFLKTVIFNDAFS